MQAPIKPLRAFTAERGPSSKLLYPAIEYPKHSSSIRLYLRYFQGDIFGNGIVLCMEAEFCWKTTSRSRCDKFGKVIETEPP